MASSYDDVRAFVAVKMQNDWTDTPVEFDDTADADHEGPWVRSFISTGIGSPTLIGGQRTIGPRVRTDHTGFIGFDVFTPVNDGKGESNRILQKLEDMFANLRASPTLVTKSAEARRVGKSGNHFQDILEIEFQRTHIPD